MAESNLLQQMSSVDEVELPESLCGHGMDCYTTPHQPGFQAVIKDQAEDFVVTEIDANGRLVQLDSFTPPPLPLPPLPSSSDADVDQSGDGITKSRPDVWEVPPLNELITQDQYKSLSELSDSVKKSHETYPGNTICLGEIADKEKRASIHIALRLAFPVLQTRTTRSEAGISEIHVLADPKYTPLCELLGEQEAERLLSFLNTSRKSEQLTLQPDPSREHRTKVHHTLSELYGQLLSTKSHTHQQGSARKRRKLNKKSAESASDDRATHIVVKFRGSPTHRRKGSNDEVVTKFTLRKSNMESLEALQRLSEVLDCSMSCFGTSGIKDKRAVTTQLVTVRGITADRLSVVASDPSLSGITIGNFEYTDCHLAVGEHKGNHFKIILRNLRSGGHVTPDDDVMAMIPQAIDDVKEGGFINYFGPQRFGRSCCGENISSSSCLIGLAILKKNYKAAVDMIISKVQDTNSDAIKEAKLYFSQTHDVAGTLDRMPHYQTREHCVLKGLKQHGFSDHGAMCALMNIPHNFRNFYIHTLTSLLWNHLATFRLREYGPQPVEGDLVMKEHDAAKLLTRKERVYMLTQQDILTGQYSLRDVVLPLLGTSSLLPGNRVADKVREIMVAVGLTLSSFRVTALRMHLPGTYRRLLAHPKQLSWRWISTEELSASRSFNSQQKSKNLELTFSLESSCYATVLLRELMKR